MSRDAWDDDTSPGNESLCVSSAQDSNGLPHDKIVSPEAIMIPGTVLPSGYGSATGYDSQVDEVLVKGLENSRERLKILKFEDRMIRFTKNRRQQELVFEPLVSYHRLVVHRLAQRFWLDHQVMDVDNEGQTASRRVVLRRTPKSKIPTLLLIDLPPPPDVDSSGGERSVGWEMSPGSRGGAKLLMRRRIDEEARGKQHTQTRTQRTPTLTDREKAYAEARAKIFGTSIADKNKGGGKVAVVSPLSQGKGKPMGGHRMAVGPVEGSRGFGRGRGKPPGPSAATLPSTAPAPYNQLQEGIGNLQEEIEQLAISQQESMEAVGEEAGNLDEAGVGGTARRRRSVNVSEWVGQRVKFRDVNTDRRDADFARGAHHYQQSGGTSNGALGDAIFYGHPAPCQTSMEADMHSRLHLAGQAYGLAISTGGNEVGGLARPGLASEEGLLGGLPLPLAPPLPAQPTSNGIGPPYLPVQHMSAAAALHPYYAATGAGLAGANAPVDAAQAFAVHQAAQQQHQAAQQQAALGGLYGYGYSGSPQQQFTAGSAVPLHPHHGYHTTPPSAGVGHTLRAQQQHQPSPAYQQPYDGGLHAVCQPSQDLPTVSAPAPLSEANTTSYEQDFPPLG